MRRCAVPAATTLAMVVLAMPAAAQTARVRLEFVGQASTDRYFEAVAVSGDYAYAVGGDYLRILDITTPATPKQVGTLGLHTFADRVVFFERGNGTYVLLRVACDTGCHYNDVEIIDVSIASQPLRVGGCGLGGHPGPYPIDLAASGNLLCVVCGVRDPPSAKALRLYDLTNPANPELLGSCALDEEASRAALLGNHVYVTCRKDSLQVIDISNPTNPCPVGWGIGGNQIAAFSGNHLGTLRSWWDARRGDEEGYSFAVIDMRDPVSPQPVGEYAAHGCARSMALANNYAYLSVSTGLQVIDVSNPAHPRWVGEYATSWLGCAVAVSGDHVYVADGIFGLQILRISELPAITDIQRTAEGLLLQWNEPAKGMILQRATSLVSPQWQALPGSEFTNRAAVQMWTGPEFFRLVKP